MPSTIKVFNMRIGKLEITFNEWMMVHRVIPILFIAILLCAFNVSIMLISVI